MKAKPSLDEYRSGGAEGAVESPSSSPVPQSVPVVAPGLSAERENKTIRIRKTYNSRLRDESFSRSKQEGRKVNESDLIDEALEAYFKKLDKRT